MKPSMDVTKNIGKVSMEKSANIGEPTASQGNKSHKVMGFTGIGNGGTKAPREVIETSDDSDDDSNAGKKIRVNNTRTSPVRGVAVPKAGKRHVSASPKKNRRSLAPRGLARTSRTKTKKNTVTFEPVTDDESDSDVLAAKAKDRAPPLADLGDAVNWIYSTRNVTKELDAAQEAVPSTSNRRATSQFKVFEGYYSALEASERTMKNSNSENKRGKSGTVHSDKKGRELSPVVVSPDPSDTKSAVNSPAPLSDKQSKVAIPGKVLMNRANDNKENRPVFKNHNGENKLAESEARVAELEDRVKRLQETLSKKRLIYHNRKKLLQGVTDTIGEIAVEVLKLENCDFKEKIIAILDNNGYLVSLKLDVSN